VLCNHFLNVVNVADMLSTWGDCWHRYRGHRWRLSPCTLVKYMANQKIIPTKQAEAILENTVWVVVKLRYAHQAISKAWYSDNSLIDSLALNIVVDCGRN
jgi:hypothetical protein